MMHCSTVCAPYVRVILLFHRPKMREARTRRNNFTSLSTRSTRRIDTSKTPVEVVEVVEVAAADAITSLSKRAAPVPVASSHPSPEGLPDSSSHGMSVAVLAR